MAANGRFSRTRIGCDGCIVNSTTTRAHASLDVGTAYRFMAKDTRDVLSVFLYWSTVGSPGEVTLTIETIDASTGKPSGSLYDANATKAFTPSAGLQQVVFDTPPTTGLTAGNEYAVVLITTTAGTTQTLRATGGSASLAHVFPEVMLTATDGTTRSNFAESTTAPPAITIEFEGGVEEPIGSGVVASSSLNYRIYGTVAGGAVFTVPDDTTLIVEAVDIAVFYKVGTPAGDLRCRIFNSSDSTVSGTTVTVDKDSLNTSALTRRVVFRFGAPVSLSVGTYRIVFDSADSANSSNAWGFYYLDGVASSNPTGFYHTETADVTAGTISWTNQTGYITTVGLWLDDITATGGGGGGGPVHLINGGLVQ